MVKVCICYCGEDEDWMSVLSLMLMPLREKYQICACSDAQPDADQAWDGEVRPALAGAAIVVALVSASFFNSRFIMEKQMPVILERRNTGLCQLHWISVRASQHRESVFSDYPALNTPGKPLSALAGHEIADEMLGICVKIRDCVFQLTGVTELKSADPALPAKANRVQRLISGIHRLQREQKESTEASINQTLRVINSNAPMELTMLTVLAQNASKIQEQIRYDQGIRHWLEELEGAGVNLADYGLPTQADLSDKIDKGNEAYVGLMKDLAKSKVFASALRNVYAA